MIEEFKTILDFDNYEISNTGKVRDKVNDRILETSVNKGYSIVGLRINGKRYIKEVHRLVAQYFIPDFESNVAVVHIDGNKKNNTVKNLKLTYRGKNKKPFVKYENGLKEDEYIKYFPKSNRWRVQIQINKDDIHCLGFLKTLEEAKIVRDKRLEDIHNGFYDK